MEPRLARGTVMHVVAALHRERQVVAERLRENVGPRPERDDCRARRERPMRGAHAPARGFGLKAVGVALHETPAEPLEAAQVDLREAVRIVHADGIGVVQCAGEDRRHVRLEVLQHSSVEKAVIHSELAMHALGFREALVALARGPKHLEPSRALENTGGAGLRRERIVLGHAMLDELRILARDLGMARRTRIHPVLPEERREPWQRRRMVVRVDRAIEAVANQRAEVVRKAVGIDAFALDETRVAERSLFRGAAAIDENDRAAALRKVKRDTDSYDPRTEYDGVAAHHSITNAGACVRLPPRTCRAC